MNSIYINPIVLSANHPRSNQQPPPQSQPFVTANGSRYLAGPTFLIRHSTTSSNYHHSHHLHHHHQQFQRTHPQMRMQFIGVAASPPPPQTTNNFIGFPLRKSSSSNNLHKVHQINSGE